MFNVGDVLYRVDIRYAKSVSKIVIDNIRDNDFVDITAVRLNGENRVPYTDFIPCADFAKLKDKFADAKTKVVVTEDRTEYYKDRDEAVKSYNGYIKKSINALKELMVK